MMKRTLKQGFVHEQVNPVDDMATFSLLKLEGKPRVPVVVGCRPEDYNEIARLSYASAAETGERPPEPEEWEIELLLGEYEFKAEFPRGEHDPVQHERTVRPPYREVALEVTS